MTLPRTGSIALAAVAAALPSAAYSPAPGETQLTAAPHGHILTNTGVWSPDGEWIAYDIRSDAEGSIFDGTRIEAVNVRTREVKTLFGSERGACCGVATWHPREPKVVFILGPENPTPDWSYNAWHRRGAIVDAREPGRASNLDARDLAPPFTPGALRGGTHVHVFSPDGRWVSFTYEDHVLAGNREETNGREINLRNVGVSSPAGPVRVSRAHPRNHDGEFFTVLATRTTANPRPGSDEISRAFEDAWIGTNGYAKADGTRQNRAIAFQGLVRTATGESIAEAFVVDLPGDPTRAAADEPLEGTAVTRPRPPAGTVQRRLTFTADRPHPGLQGPRHWLRSSPDGSRIAFLMKDDTGVVQLWTVSPNGGAPRQVTRNPWSVTSAFNWSPDGRWIACAADNCVVAVEAATGRTARLTPPSAPEDAPLPLSVSFSPDGRLVAYQRRVATTDGGPRFNQVFVCSTGVLHDSDSK